MKTSSLIHRMDCRHWKATDAPLKQILQAITSSQCPGFFFFFLNFVSFLWHFLLVLEKKKLKRWSCLSISYCIHTKYNTVKGKSIKEQQKTLSDLVSVSQHYYIYSFSFYFCIFSITPQMTTGLCVTFHGSSSVPAAGTQCAAFREHTTPLEVFACHYGQKSLLKENVH